MATSGKKHPPTAPYETPDACEAAFYAAFRAGDLDAMGGTWGSAAHVVCVHPGRPPLAGRRDVMASWEQILGSTGGVRVRFECNTRARADGLAVHTGVEVIGTPDGAPARVTVTNVYELTPSGWTMRLHHAGPVHAVPPRSRPLH